MTKSLLAWIFLAALAPGLHAAEDIVAASDFAFPSVQEGGSARAIALGSTYVGIAEGSASMLWNPAGLATMLYPEISLHHNAALLGAYQDIAILGLPLGHRQGLGLSLNYDDSGTFDGRDEAGLQTGDYSARAYGGSLGWAIRGPIGLNMGLALKVNSQDLAGSVSTAVAGDFGILWDLYPRVSLGAAYTNLGPSLDGHPLAQGLRVGVSSYIEQDRDNEFLFALSGESITEGASSLHAGIEQTIHHLLALRAGYAMDIPKPQMDGLLGWTFGAGIILSNFSVDYAFVPLAELGSMQRISLTYVFGERGGPSYRESGAANVKPSSSPGFVPGGSYVVKEGDSLWKISGKNKVMGDSFLWPLLFKSNGDQVANPDQIKPDQDLKFKRDYSADEIKKAKKKAEDMPVYTP